MVMRHGRRSPTPARLRSPNASRLAPMRMPAKYPEDLPSRRRFDGAGFDHAGQDGALIFTPQATEGITYAHKIDKPKRGSIGTKPAADLHNLVRGLAQLRRVLRSGAGKGVERVKVYARRISKDAQGHPAAFSTRI